MRTCLLTRLDVDPERLAKDLAALDGLRWNDSYREFGMGEFDSSILWNRSGSTADVLLEDYDAPGRLTSEGAQLPYVFELVRGAFDTTHLRFARLVRIQPGSALVPHRDYIELEDRLARFHIPLRTDDRCFSAQDDVVFQIRAGEAWYLDASRMHSAAVFSDVARTHLILDFGNVADPLSLLRVPVVDDAGIPADHVVDRPPVTDDEQAALRGLAPLLHAATARDVLSMIVKLAYTRDVAMTAVFGWLADIAATANPGVAAHVADMERYYAIQR